MGFCYLDQLFLLARGTSHDTLINVKLMISFSINMDVLPVNIFYRLYHTFYFYLPFARCSLYSQFIISHTTFFSLVPLVIYIECAQFLSTSPEVIPEYNFAT